MIANHYRARLELKIMQAPTGHYNPQAAAPVATSPTAASLPTQASGGGSSNSFSLIFTAGLALFVFGVLLYELPDIQGEPTKYDYHLDNNDLFFSENEENKYFKDRTLFTIQEDRMQSFGTVLKAGGGALLVFALINEGASQVKLPNGVRTGMIAGAAFIAAQFFGVSLF